MDSTEFESAPVPIAENGHANGDDLPLAAAVEEVEPQLVPRGLYLVRIPRAPVDDSNVELKKLQADFQNHVAKLKAMNAKLSAKREEVRGFKRQMGEARGLKETSEPEFQEKSDRMKELRTLRSSYLDRIREIKENLTGLDCKSEQELDDKIKQLEHRIAHEGMPLREEKQAVQQIAKLKAMRPRIKEYDLHKSSLVELETEAQKIKAIIADMEGEFSVIKSERDATKKVVQDIYGNLKKAQEELAVLDAEHAELVAAKEATLKALDSTRDETNASMRDYRENRKFALNIRDMVAAGQHEEAAELVNAQVNEWVARLSSDNAYRAEYDQLWASLRKFPVSELLPKSCTAPPPEASSSANGGARGGGRGGAGGRGQGGAAAPPPEPRGKEKAELLIQQLMQEASKEAALNKARQGPANGDYDDDDDEPAPAPSAAAAAAPAASAAAVAPAAAAKKPAVGSAAVGGAAANAKLVQDPAAAAAAAFNFKVELPKVPDLNEQFVVPVIKNEEPQVTKEQLREEQARKAAEAEERKRKRAEQAERRKQQAAEAAKRLEQERKERDVAARRAAAEQAQQAAQQQQAEEQVPTGDEGATATAAGGNAQQTEKQQQLNKYSAPTAFEKRQMLAAAKRPKSRSTPIKQVQSIWNQYQGWIIFVAVMLIVIILGIAFLM